jgi:hypothetical protein
VTSARAILPTTAAAAAARSAETAAPESTAGGSSIRKLPRGGDVQIVPGSVCSSRVAAVVPASPALCLTVTPEEASALGLPPDPERTSPNLIAGLPFTGASVATGAVLGALALALGMTVHRLSHAHRRRRAALA